MKKILILVLNVLLFIFLCGCSSPVYTIKEDGKTYKVNHYTKSIYDGTYTYQFSYSGDPYEYDIKIYYPNDVIYFESYEEEQQYEERVGRAEDFKGFDDEGYLIGNEEYASAIQLCDYIRQKEDKGIPAGKFWGVVLCIGFGIFSLVAPRKVWFLEGAWRYANVEPSAAGLAFVLIKGVVFIIFGVLLIFV